MRTAKAVATVAVFLVLVWTAACFAPHGCGTFSAWALGVLGYDHWHSWAMLGCMLWMFYAPVYDLVAFGAYKLGFEDHFDGIKMYPEYDFPHREPVPPMTMQDKLIFVYPLWAIVGALAAAMWFASVWCWPWGRL